MILCVCMKSPSANPTADLPDNGELVANILEGSTATSFGCVKPGKPWRWVDGTTDRFICDRTDMHNVTTGVIFSNNHGQRSIPKALRMYSSNVCRGCDPVSYALEGRLDFTDTWTEIGSGSLPWMNEEWSDILRNDQGLQINSTYESGDSNLYFTTIHYHGHSDQFLEYKVTFISTREPGRNVGLAELEITGLCTCFTVSLSIFPFDLLYES